MAARKLSAKQRSELQAELDELRQAHEALVHRHRGLLGEYHRVGSDLHAAELRMRRLIRRLYGIDIAAEPARADGVVTADTTRDMRRSSRRTARAAPEIEEADASTPSDDDEVRDEVTTSDEDTHPDATSWNHMLRNDQMRRSWRNVQTLRKALERLGGGGFQREIRIEAVQIDPHFTLNRVSSILERDCHFAKGQDGKWRYVPGPPQLSPRDQRVHRHYDLLIETVIELGGAAKWRDIVDAIQRKESPDVFTGPNVSRYLKSGPFIRDGRGRWSYNEEAGFRPMNVVKKETAARQQVLKQHATFVQLEAIADVDPCDPAVWPRMVWNKNQEKRWEIVQASEMIIEDAGGAISKGRLLEALACLDIDVSDSNLLRHLMQDPHYVLDERRRWRFVPGPPFLTTEEQRVWKRREMLRKILIESGGTLRFSALAEEYRKRAPDDKLSNATLSQTLRLGPFERTEDGGRFAPWRNKS